MQHRALRSKVVLVSVRGELKRAERSESRVNDDDDDTHCRRKSRC